MKTTINRLATVVLLLALFSGADVRAGEEADAPDERSALERAIDRIEFEFDATLASKYVWRGISVVNDWVFQPAFDVSFEGFAVNVWANQDLTDANDERGSFTEVDLTGSWTHEWEPVSVTVGSVSYLYPRDGGDTTTELFAAVAVDVPFEPTLTVYKDVNETFGAYWSLAAGYRFEDLFGLGGDESLSPSIATSVGWGSRSHNDFNYGVRHSGLADLTTTVSLPLPLSDAFETTLTGGYALLLDGDLRADGPGKDHAWLAVSMTIGF